MVMVRGIRVNAWVKMVLLIPTSQSLVTMNVQLATHLLCEQPFDTCTCIWLQGQWYLCVTLGTSSSDDLELRYAMFYQKQNST